MGKILILTSDPGHFASNYSVVLENCHFITSKSELRNINSTAIDLIIIDEENNIFNYSFNEGERLPTELFKFETKSIYTVDYCNDTFAELNLDGTHIDYLSFYNTSEKVCGAMNEEYIRCNSRGLPINPMDFTVEMLENMGCKNNPTADINLSGFHNYDDSRILAALHLGIIVLP